jgi:hypothetical protein
MPTDLQSMFSRPALLWTIACGLLAVGFSCGAMAAHRRHRAVRLGFSVVSTSLLVLLCIAFATLTLGTAGYRALTREVTAAVVRVEPLGPQRFRAHFEFPTGRMASFELAGDELYVDARILKWKSFANLIGLHTEYELDRVSGRYIDMRDERMRARTVYRLVHERPIDVFQLARKHTQFRPFVDAEYGSATFVHADRGALFEVRVSTSGLLIREVPDGSFDQRSAGISPGS